MHTAYEISVFNDSPSLEYFWSSSDDAVLRNLAETYPGSWRLIADIFNSSRVLVKTDQRAAIDCCRRWRQLHPKDSRAPSEVPSSPAIPLTPNSMLTRGTKRTAAQASGSTTGANPPTQTKARKRHGIMIDVIRKYAKKRDTAARALGTI